MVLTLFRRRANRPLIDRIHGAIVVAARQPHLYGTCGVADSFEGRFEMVALHAALVLRRLRDLEQPGPQIAQDVVDRVFDHFDVALREIGISDVAVPKRMKKLAESFFGRAAAYDAALRDESDAPLAAALARNVFGSPAPAGTTENAQALARYVRGIADALGKMSLAEFLAAPRVVPDPHRTWDEAS
jgi:cytochrome b pre-mRNA-processing protein 3